MISVDTAHLLRDAGVRWEPEAGDRFVITNPHTDDEVYVVSDMTIDVHRFASGTVIGFNGTTEWALDSIEQDRALWLPRETQLRAMLGNTFRRFERVEPAEPAPPDDADSAAGTEPDGGVEPAAGASGNARAEAGGWRVELVVVGQPVVVVDDDAEQAYARALLMLITGADVPGGSDRT